MLSKMRTNRRRVHQHRVFLWLHIQIMKHIATSAITDPRDADDASLRMKLYFESVRLFVVANLAAV